MLSPRLRHLRNILLALGLLALGLWQACGALWQLIRTAMYVHESVIVTGTVVDVRQKPFESWGETLGTGNWSWPGDVSYQPIVRFTLPGGINAIRLDLEADNVDYQIGQDVSIISPPNQPGKARINRWKFIWGADCLLLGTGSVLSLIGYGLLKRLNRRRPHAAKAAPAKSATAKQPRQNTAPNTPKAPRQRKAASGTPRRRKKAENAPADTTTPAPPKPRRSRKKKAEPQQGELPL